MKKSLIALAAAAAFTAVSLAGSAVAAPVPMNPSVTQSHDALTVVKTGHRAAHHKGAHKNKKGAKKPA
jgi:hypothetical protein